MSKRVIKRTTSEWKLLIEEYEARSESCAYFCKHHQVSKSQVYKWRSYFLSQKKSIDKESAFIPLAVNNGQEPSQHNFSNITAKHTILNTGPITSEIKISNRSGVVVEFISGCRYSELKAIMEILHATK